MPKVSQAHLDARRQQIVDAARVRFSEQGFARTSMADIVDEAGLSNGAIYRYFAAKEEIVVAVCEQASGALPDALTADAVTAFLEHLRRLSSETGHARLVAQIYAEAALSPTLAEVVRGQLETLRGAVADLVREDHPGDRMHVAEAFVAICGGYSEQLTVRGDLDPAPFVTAVMAVVGMRA